MRAHRLWASFINGRGRWRGHLFDGRFASVAMDDDHVIAAVRYVAMNPVRAGLVARPTDWPWSSVHAHLAGRDDGLVTVAPILALIEDLATLLDSPGDEAAFARLRSAEVIGRPLGTPQFVADLEQRLGRRIARRGPGRKPRHTAPDQPGLF